MVGKLASQTQLRKGDSYAAFLKVNWRKHKPLIGADSKATAEGKGEYKVEEQIDAKTLHILSHMRLTLNTLPWKRNRLLLRTALMVYEY
jgi:hypothetical protein